MLEKNKSTIYKKYSHELLNLLDVGLEEKIMRFVNILQEGFYSGNSIYIAGNGGSAATAMHFVCDLCKLRNIDGRGFKAIALNSNMPYITAIANDDDYKYIFKKQIESLLQPGDILVIISASGNSKNILEAIVETRERKGKVIGLLGFDGGEAIAKIDEGILIPCKNYGIIEDIHLIICHIVAQTIKEAFKSEDDGK